MEDGHKFAERRILRSVKLCLMHGDAVKDQSCALRAVLLLPLGLYGAGHRSTSDWCAKKERQFTRCAVPYLWSPTLASGCVVFSTVEGGNSAGVARPRSGMTNHEATAQS